MTCLLQFSNQVSGESPTISTTSTPLSRPVRWGSAIGSRTVDAGPVVLAVATGLHRRGRPADRRSGTLLRARRMVEAPPRGHGGQLTSQDLVRLALEVNAYTA